jgi:hypothetical protein
MAGVVEQSNRVGSARARGVDPRAETLGPRYTDYGPIVSDALAPPTPATVGQGIADQPNVVHLGSSLEDQTTPELMIDGQPRGALSWAFARALRGMADSDGDGRIVLAEIRSFVIEAVRQQAESRQTPSINSVMRGEDTVLQSSATSAASAIPEQVLAPGEPLPLAIVGVAAERAEALFGQLRDVARAEPGAAKLIWDEGKDTMVSGLGDVVAYPAGLAQAQSTIDKWRLLDRIKALAEAHPLAVRVAPDDGLHVENARVGIAVADPQMPHLAVFNLAGTGVLNLLYPREGDPPQLTAGAAFAIDTAVTPPFGADHVVAVASEQPLDGLLGLLRILDGQTAGEDVAAALASALAGTRYRLGLVGLYTGPE